MHKFSSLSLSGLLFAFLGLVAIAFPLLSTVAMDSLLAAIFLVGGIFHLVAVLDDKGQSDFLWNLVIGLAFLMAGVLMIAKPFAAASAVTLFLMLLFFVQGVATLLSALRLKAVTDKWTWFLVSSILSFAIAYMIWADFPNSASWLVGTLAGVYLLMFGISLMARGGHIGQD